MNAWTRLQLLGELPATEHYSPSKAKAGEYTAALKAYNSSHDLPGQAGTTTRKEVKVLTLEEISERIRRVMAEGATDVVLTAEAGQLAGMNGQSTSTVLRLVEQIRKEEALTARIAAEARAIEQEADRKDIARGLTPEYLLPAVVAGAIATRTRYLPTDGPAAVLPYLAAVAGLVQLGTTVVGNPVASVEVPLNLFGCLVGRSGAKKSPVGRLLVSAPTAALRLEQAEANDRALNQWQEACVAAKALKEAAPPEPAPVRLVVTEYSGESLTEQLMTQEKAGRGLLIHRDEIAGLFAGLNQYRGGKGADEQQMLELYDGEGLTSLRITAPRAYTRSQVSIWGTTQPEVLRELVASGDASGLWARFLFVPLPERVVPLPVEAKPDELAEVQAAAQMLADVARTIHDLPPRRYDLNAEAIRAWTKYEEQHQGLALKATIGAQSALYGKSAGKVLRVAGLLHLLKVAIGEASRDALIDADCISKAITLVDHLDQWALSLHAEVATGETTGLMCTVHRLAEAAGQPIRWKEIWHRLSKAQRKEADAAAGNAAMRALAAAGYGEIEEGKRGALAYRALKPLP